MTRRTRQTSLTSRRSPRPPHPDGDELRDVMRSGGMPSSGDSELLEALSRSVQRAEVIPCRSGHERAQRPTRWEPRAGSCGNAPARVGARPAQSPRAGPSARGLLVQQGKQRQRPIGVWNPSRSLHTLITQDCLYGRAACRMPGRRNYRSAPRGITMKVNRPVLSDASTVILAWCYAVNIHQRRQGAGVS